MAVMAVLADGAGDDDGDGRAGAGADADGGGAGRCSRMMLVVGRWSAEKGTHGSMMPVMRVMMQTLPDNRSSKNDYIYTFCQLPLTLLVSAPGSALGGSNGMKRHGREERALHQELQVASVRSS